MKIHLSALLLWLSAMPYALFAQENNWWTVQPGTRSALLGGAVVGGVRDNSATYYNPGALAFVHNPSLSISANAYQYVGLSIANGAGTGEDLSSGQIQVMPLLLSGVKLLPKAPRLVLGYALLTRHQSTVNTTARRDASLLVFNGATTPQDYIGQLTYRNGIRELWAGGTASYRLSSNLAHQFSIGLSTFVAFRQQNYFLSVGAQALNPTTSGNIDYVASTSNVEQADLLSFRLITKLGFAYESHRIKLGLTLTAPSITLGGSATAARDNQITNLYRTIPQTRYLDILASDRQEGLAVTWRTPFSIALGAEFALGKTTLSLSGEWFDAMKGYDVVSPEPKPFIRPSTTDYPVSAADFLRIRQSHRSVINGAIGIEQRVSDRLSLLAGFRTDFSSDNTKGINTPSRNLSTDNSIATTATRLDIYHASLGMTLRRAKSDLSAGVQYSFGNQSGRPQLTNMSDPRDITYLFSRREETSISYTAIGLILGFTHYLR